MKKSNVLFLLIVSIFLSTVLLGCLNYEQIVKLNKNGSGSMKIHYWTAESNVMNITKFSFDESEIKNEQYKPLTVKHVVITSDEMDSTRHVYVELDFKDINKLDSIKGFAGNSIKFFPDGDYIKLIHVIKQDSVAYSFGMDEYILKYTYEFPSSPLNVDPLGVVKGNVVTWNYKYSDLAMNDIIMTASIKKPSFGISLVTHIFSITVALAIVFYILYYRKQVKKRIATKKVIENDNSTDSH